MTTTAASGRRIRPVRIATNDSIVHREPDGTIRMTSPLTLGPYSVRLTDALDEWAERTPNRPYLAQRTDSGSWRTVSYADARTRVRPRGRNWPRVLTYGP